MILGYKRIVKLKLVAKKKLSNGLKNKNYFILLIIYQWYGILLKYCNEQFLLFYKIHFHTTIVKIKLE
jgi:sulfur relay (sulfurtransferase) DsrF/TusC family protein